MDSKHLLVGLVFIVIVSGCVKEKEVVTSTIEEYVCPDGSKVISPEDCPKTTTSISTTTTPVTSMISTTLSSTSTTVKEVTTTLSELDRKFTPRSFREWSPTQITKKAIFINVHTLLGISNAGSLIHAKHNMWEKTTPTSYTINLDYIPKEDLFREDGTPIDLEWRGKVIFLGVEWYVVEITEYNSIYLAKGKILENVGKEKFSRSPMADYNRMYLGYKFKLDQINKDGNWTITSVSITAERPDGTQQSLVIRGRELEMIDDIGVMAINAYESTGTATLFAYDLTSIAVIQDGAPLKGTADWQVTVETSKQPLPSDAISKGYGDIGEEQELIKSIEISKPTATTLPVTTTSITGCIKNSECGVVYYGGLRCDLDNDGIVATRYRPVCSRDKCITKSSVELVDTCPSARCSPGNECLNATLRRVPVEYTAAVLITSKEYSKEFQGYKFRLNKSILSAIKQPIGLRIDVKNPYGWVSQMEITDFRQGEVDNLRIVKYIGYDEDWVEKNMSWATIFVKDNCRWYMGNDIVHRC